MKKKERKKERKRERERGQMQLFIVFAARANEQTNLTSAKFAMGSVVLWRRGIETS